jgi:NAD(P)-dependent dehydrogenase (short-subunit alcohol dehydrogenase family)
MDNLFRLDNKVVVITGAAGLLGIKHAEAIASSGGIPILLDIKEERVDQLANELSKRFSVSALGLCVDITNESSVIIACENIVDRYGSIHGLVNNAANNPIVSNDSNENFSRLENFTPEQWNMDIAVGLTGSWLCAKHFGAQMVESKQGGSIVNISSDLGLIAPDQGLYKRDNLPDEKQPVKPVTYSVVKTGLLGLTRYLATYWADAGVRCNAICPGGVENDQPELFLNRVRSKIPMGRLARANEYQGTLVWMLSEASSYLNGAIIPVDGGRTAW